jgi:hypothetical protein
VSNTSACNNNVTITIIITGNIKLGICCLKFDVLNKDAEIDSNILNLVTEEIALITTIYDNDHSTIVKKDGSIRQCSL